VALNYSALVNWPFPDNIRTYSEQDIILYALGLGIGTHSTDERELRFVYGPILITLPTFAVTLGHPGNFWEDPGTGIEAERVLHGEHRLTVYSPLPPSGEVRAQNRVISIVDKGEDALVYVQRQLSDASSGLLLATQTTTAFCRGAGGFDGPTGSALRAHLVPDRAPDLTIDHQTAPQLALIYRLSGDLNPLHADPWVAARAGYDRPILHGLCTYGIAGYSLLAGLCDYEPSRLRKLDGRFTSPAYPGETFRTQVWVEGPGLAAFRCSVPARGKIVIDNGYCEYEVRGAA
jgi:acyl dehydratase